MKKFFSRMSSIAFCFCGLITAVPVAIGGIEVEPIDSGDANIRVHFPNITERSMFQRSYDLLDWTDFLPVGSEVSGNSFLDPTSKEEKALFYRLKPIENTSEGRFYVHLHPTDYLLFSYWLGEDVEFHIYGTRDSSGLPQNITEYLFRAGDTLYTGKNPEIEDAQSLVSEQTNHDIYDSVSYLNGYVFVENSENCPASNVPPRVEWRVTEHSDVEYIGQPVSGDIQTAPAPEDFQIEGFKVYTYAIPWRSSGYQVPPPVDLKQFTLDIFGPWLEAIFLPDDAAKQASDGLALIAEIRRIKSINPLVGAASTLISIAMATIAAETAVENYDFGPTEAYGEWEAEELVARAIIPDGEGGSINASEWTEINKPILMERGPDLIIVGDPCSDPASTPGLKLVIDPANKRAALIGTDIVWAQEYPGLNWILAGLPRHRTLSPDYFYGEARFSPEISGASLGYIEFMFRNLYSYEGIPSPQGQGIINVRFSGFLGKQTITGTGRFLSYENSIINEAFESFIGLSIPVVQGVGSSIKVVHVDSID